MLPCANQSEKPVSVEPPEACTSPELLGVAAVLLHGRVVRRGARKSPPFFSFFLEPTQWLSVRGLGKAEQKGSERVSKVLASPSFLEPGKCGFCSCTQLHTLGAYSSVCSRTLLTKVKGAAPPEQGLVVGAAARIVLLSRVRN